jgi:DNA invertase Pin-like site-specific DNA recombinase
MTDARHDAVAYMRVPTAADSFARQRRRIREYAANHGLKISGEFKDTCISTPAGLKDRRGLAALFDYIERHGHVDVVLIEKDDCLGDEILSEIILAQFRSLHVRVGVADSGAGPGSDSSADSRTPIRKILSAAEKFEKFMFPVRLKAGRERVRQQGMRCEGRKPFGFHDHEVETLNRILTLHRKERGKERLGYYRIATILNKEGHRTRSGKPWTGPTVRGIIQRHKKEVQEGKSRKGTSRASPQSSN